MSEPLVPPSSSAFVVVLPGGARFAAADAQQLAQWVREKRVPLDAMIEEEGLAPVLASEHPVVRTALSTPPTVPGELARPAGDDSMATLIPYKNASALIGYYTSIGSLIPLVGAVAGPIAIVLGVKGLKAVRADPRVKGTVHAWIAIVLGGIGTLLSLGCLSTLLVGVFAK